MIALDRRCHSTKRWKVSTGTRISAAEALVTLSAAIAPSTREVEKVALRCCSACRVAEQPPTLTSVITARCCEGANGGKLNTEENVPLIGVMMRKEGANA